MRFNFLFKYYIILYYMNYAHSPPPYSLQPRYRYKIHDKLYDLTDFVNIHPGGTDMFNNLKPDTNITPMFYAYHKNPKTILAMLPKYEVSSTNAKTDLIKIEYDTNYTYDKYCELKKLVYDEIQEKKIPLYWSNKELAYNAFMLSVYLGMWGYCFWNANNLSYWWMILLGLFTTSWGTLIFHETSHYTGFKNQQYNVLISQYYPFADINYWKYNHNYLHHSFTNTKYDHDTSFIVPIFRVLHNQTLMYYHKYQHIYVWIFNLFVGIFPQKNTFFNILSTHKYCLFLFLFFFNFRYILTFYIAFSFIWMSSVLLPHFQDDIITKIGDDFLYNQVSNTINYKTNNIIRFIVYGVDIQIEHHLFPNIPHSSLRQIQHIVRDYCTKNDIPYIEKPSIFPTIYSYICYLYKMGEQ
jgi:linoleoyl-CoA desaturase